MTAPAAPSSEGATALLLVDVTNSFFLEGMPNYYQASAEVLEPLRRLLAQARAAKGIVVHAVEQHYPGFEDYEWRKLPRHHFIGDPDAAFFAGFEPVGAREIIMRKRRYSAFFATDLALFLHEQNIARVVIAGVKTNVCIRATAQDAFANGFDVVVPREATNSNRPHLAEASLEDIERYIGRVTSLDAALEMLGMTAIAVTGYASLDYCVRLDRAARPDATATVLARPLEWPRLGGSPAYVASAIAAAGMSDVGVVSWVGADADGRGYREALSRRGVGVEGIAVRPGRTPICILAYQPDGGCHCFYDPSLAGPFALDADQEALVRGAQWICLTVGPPEATREILAAARPNARIVWSVKADPRSMPPDLAGAVAARADVIAWSRGEARFVEDALAACGAPERGRLLLETRGTDGVALRSGGREAIIGVEALAADDTTGAGDTFLGGFLAALIAAPGEPADAVAAGAKAARAMLAARG